jgi:uncharacterized membrane protein YkvA (DUF1232 family)
MFARAMPWTDSRIAETLRRMAGDETGIRRDFWAKFRRLAARLPFAEDLLAAYYCAFDRDTPTHVRASLVAALAYFILPSDAVPDLLPALGFADDAAVLAGVLRLMASAITPAHRTAARDALTRGAGPA